MNIAIRSAVAVAVGVVLAASALSLHAGPAARDQQAPVAVTARAEGSESLASRLRQRIPELMEQAGVQGVQIAVLGGGKAGWHGPSASPTRKRRRR